MHHTIEFRSDFLIDLDASCSNSMKQMRVRKGTRLEATIRPYVVKVGEQPVEVADLYVENGNILRMVPFGLFFFVE